MEDQNNKVDKKIIVKEFINKYSKKKRTWLILALVILIGFFILKPASSSDKIVLDTVKYVDLKQTVLATGQVTSSVDLDLSFNSTGIVKSLRVNVGDKVKAGDILATIDQGSQLAELTQARGALASARARYKKTLEGSSSEEVALAQVTLDQTKISQETLVENAYQNLLNSTPEAIPSSNEQDITAPKISGTYSLSKEGEIRLKTYLSNGGYSFTASGLTTGTATAKATNPQPIGDSGLYVTFSNSFDNSFDWIINIPNKKAPDYLANYNAYQSAKAQARLIIEQKEAELALKRAKARTPDLDLAQAEIVSAEGQVQAASSRYENTLLRAPASGTITSIDIKLGELSEVQKQVVTLQDISNLYVEAKINESSIANVKLGQKVTMSFNAFGSSRSFEGAVVHVDPSATTADGIVNYKIKLSISSADKEGIRSGMNADINILTNEKPHVLVVPKASIISRDGKKFVNIITDKDHKKYKEQEVQTGLLGDGNLIEVTSGLTSGQDIAIISK